MHKPGGPGPIVVRQWFRKHRMKGEVGVLCGQSVEVVLIKEFLPGAGAIPEGHPASCSLRIEQKRQVRTQWSHSRAATQVDHFLAGILDQKISERTGQLDRISSAKTVCISGTNAGITVLASRRRGNANVELELAMERRICCKRVIAAHGGIGPGPVLKEVVCAPYLRERIF